MTFPTEAKLEVLAPDDIDRHYAMHENALPRCPFCGGQAITMRSVNAITKNIVARVACAKCIASTLYVDKNPDKARQLAIEKWKQRPHEFPVNLNELVRFKLTPQGEQAIRDYCARWNNEANPPEGCEMQWFKHHQPDGDGYYHEQLWHLMEMLGPSMYMGMGNVYFERNEIRIRING